ncbi:hypothetical protein GCM10020001_027290 [Nonomuraea salmonea]
MFLWGTATAAYQIEGATGEDGRGPSIWDTFAREPGRTRDGHTGDVACDHYHRWREDVALMADLGVNAYRFSIAWPRVLPDGAGQVNGRGLDFYDRLVDALLAAGVQPVPTLFHWDLPQALEDRGGWLNRDVAELFADYAGVVAARLADRVPLWITLNEPFVHMAFGYAMGLHAPRPRPDDRRPARRAPPVARPRPRGGGAQGGRRAPGGADQQLHPGLARLVAGAGRTGRRGVRHPAQPPVHRPGADRRLPRPVGLHRRPRLRQGRRPGDRLGPPSTRWASTTTTPPASPPPTDEGLPFTDAGITGHPTTAFGWPVVPDGLRELLTGLKSRYGAALPPILVTENGCSQPDVPGPDGTIDDAGRIAFLDGHIAALRRAMDEGVDVRGYFVWSLIDNFEWAEGYHQRFGLVHVDHATQRRTPKRSYHWYRDFLRAQNTDT